MKNIKMSLVILASLAVSLCNADVNLKTHCAQLSQEALETLNKMNQGFTFFEYTKGVKYPKIVIYNPNSCGATITTLLMGTKKTLPTLVTKAEDLAHMVPLRKFWLDSSVGLKMEEKYPGLSETLLGKAFYRVARTIDLYNKNYKGTPIVDEYRKENPMPMNFKLGTLNDLRCLQAYLEPRLQEKANDTKPLLLLEIAEQGNDALTADDLAFLNRYFILLDVQDAAVKAFFETMRKNFEVDQSKFGGAKTVGEKFGDIVMGSCEKTFGEFKTEKLASDVLLALLAGYSANSIWKMIQDKEIIASKDTMKTAADYTSKAVYGLLGTTAAALGVAAAYEYMHE